METARSVRKFKNSANCLSKSFPLLLLLGFPLSSTALKIFVVCEHFCVATRYIIYYFCVFFDLLISLQTSVIYFSIRIQKNVYSGEILRIHIQYLPREYFENFDDILCFIYFTRERERILIYFLHTMDYSFSLNCADCAL